MKIEQVIIFKDGRLKECEWVFKPYRDIPVDEQTWKTKTGLTVFHGEFRFGSASDFVQSFWGEKIATLSSECDAARKLMLSDPEKFLQKDSAIFEKYMKDADKIGAMRLKEYHQLNQINSWEKKFFNRH